MNGHERYSNTHPEVRDLSAGIRFRFFSSSASLHSRAADRVRSSAISRWWIPVVIAYFIGAFANHCLFVLIHECAHNLIFKRKSANILAGIIADFPNLVPSSVSFRSYHLKHHSFQGDYDLDADLPSRWEAKLIGSSLPGKALWLLLLPRLPGFRPPRLKEITFANAWTAVNWVIVAGIRRPYRGVFGPGALLYLGLSFFFSIGLHPLGARWIQEHYLTLPRRRHTATTAR